MANQADLPVRTMCRVLGVTTRRDKRQTPACDLVNRRFHATGPNQLWVADMTYVPTWIGLSHDLRKSQLSS